MGKNEIENIEIRILLEAIFQRYGHDFRNYSKPTIKRRINAIILKSDCKNVTELIRKILYNESFFEWFLTHLSITVTEWFRNPLFYLKLRQAVIPYLQTFPFIKIWNPGCATGEEVYSFSIILKEEGLHEQATIYATDFNDDALKKAKQGIYPQKDIYTASQKYQKTQGTQSLSDYVHMKYNSGIVSPLLKQKITFANHNLATDNIFGEMHLISCRNVLMYFNKTLKNRALKLFHDSLIFKGFLCLGNQESLDFSEIRDHYKIVDRKQKIYQKISC